MENPFKKREPKSARINVRLSNSEFLELNRLSYESGESMSTILRRAFKAILEAGKEETDVKK